MKNFLPALATAICMCCALPWLPAQNANCTDGTVTGSDSLTGTVFFNYGSVTNAFSVKNRTTSSVGEPFLGAYFSQINNGVAGFYSRFLLPPTPPTVFATEGDLADRIQVNWVIDPLSPSPEQGFNIYRDGAFLDQVEKEVRVYVDFNVQAGQFYNYEIRGVNTFGEGVAGTSLGFLNPNGVITGQVRTFSGNAVPGAAITLLPTLGTALRFTGDDVAFAEFDSALLAPAWTVSCWVKAGEGNDHASIIDFGSTTQKNWWLTTRGSGAAKGVRFHIGDGATTRTITYAFPTGPDDWHHVAATYSGSSLLFYVDGILTGTLAAPVAADTLPLFFGRRPGTMAGYFTGGLDEVRIFSRQLSQTEINHYRNRTVNSDAGGLSAYWKFDEGVGTKGYDISSKRLKTYLCGPEWTTDRPNVVNGAVTDASGFYKIEGINYGPGTTFTASPSKVAYDNYALEFNGVNQQYAVLTDSVLSGAQDATIELRVQNFENSPATRTILANQSADGTANFFALDLDDDLVTIRLGGESRTFGALGAGYRHVVAALKNNAGSIEATVYINGVPRPVQVYPGPLPDFAPQTWQLGARKTGSGHDRFFSGLIDEVAFYDTALTQVEVQLNLTQGANATHPRLRSWFPLNESMGTALADIGPDRTGQGSVHGALWSTVTGLNMSTNHEFQPDKRLVTLNPSNTSNDQVDFTDLSTVSVSGYVRFDGTDCFAEGVEILVNGAPASPRVFTDEDGRFVVDFEPGSTAVLTPVFSNHQFSPAFWQVQNLNAPLAGILFRDVTKRNLRGLISGGLCESGLLGLGDSLKITVATPGADPCFSREFTLIGEGDGTENTYSFSGLPPRELTVSVSFHSNTTIYTYFQQQGGANVDLRDVNDTIDFNYVAPPLIEVAQGLDPVLFCATDTLIQQFERYTVNFKVYQQYAVEKCYLQEAVFSLDNGLADLPPLDTVMIGGNLRYAFRAGEPVLAAPHLKTLTATAWQADNQSAVKTIRAVVLGQKSTGVTFATTAPNTPFMILRDPPGDGSSATIESGETVCNSMALSVTDANAQDHTFLASLGYKSQVAVGIGVLIFSERQFVNETTYSMSGVTGETLSNEMEVCLTTNQVISTNDADDLMGRDADVFVGGAINFDFGLTNILAFDTMTCSVYRDTGIIAAPTGVATTYVYQRHDIVNQVIPNLMLSMLPTAAADIARWNEILALDDSLQLAAVFDENISFTGGVYYEKSTTSERTDTYTQTFETEVSQTVANVFGLFADNIGASYGFTMALTTTESKDTSSSTASSTTVGYTLHDDDIGDLFSVTVKQDRRYATPVFSLVAGETSCPWEAPTQKRNYVDFTAASTSVANVGSNEAAVFDLALANQSETGEARTYTLSIGANPLGAQVKAEGQQLTATGLEFEVPDGQSLPVKLTVERGLLSYTYQDIEIVLAASCEDASVEGFSKSLLLDVQFVEPCSEVDIAFPMQNDVINTASGNALPITIDSYDKTDPDLELIRIQYRPKFGDGSWINILPVSEIPQGDLNQVSTTRLWDVTALTDGPYELRALTQCTGGNQAPGISTIINLRVEREAPSLLGVPEPADGVLSPGDEISIAFNEEVKCNSLIQAAGNDNNNIGLYRSSTGELINATISCFENRIVIVPNIQNAFIEGDILRVEVDDIEDLAGNVFSHAEWEFFVDRSPLLLEGGALNVTMYEGEEKIVLRNLANVGGSIAAFEIDGTPVWANIYPNIGTLLPGEEVVITYQFPASLPQGNYTDTIHFLNAQGDERVILNLRVLCPPPQWEVDPAAYPSSMNFTVMLDIEGVGSEDPEDRVAAFIDGELRGVAHVQYLESLDAYMAFLSVYGDSLDQDQPIELEIWDASACLLYSDLLEQFDFGQEEVVGLLDDPVVLHTSGMVHRDIPLTTGWNWISFNLGLPDPDLDAALVSLEHPENDLIKAQNAYALYSGGWFGSLGAVDHTGMFQYRADQPDTIRMTGGLIDPASVQIPIASGWNWIGYLPNYALPVSEALAGLMPLNGDIIKGQSAFAQYLAGHGWIGSLQYMEAPKGYQLKIGNPGTLTYPDNFQAPAQQNRGGQPDGFWEVNPSQFEYSMTLLGMVSAGGQNVTQEGHEIGAFAGAELRGATPAIYVVPLDAYLFFLTVFSNQPGEPLNFQLYDGASGQVSGLSESMFFVTDQHQGTMAEPVPFTLAISGVSAAPAGPYLEVRPNPFRSATTLQFGCPYGQEVRLVVTDVAGQTVQEEKIAAAPGLNRWEWQAAGLASGLYFVRLETAQGVAVRKVVLE